MITGADAMVRTLANCGVRACFANPGTSEMHLVAALDREPRIRSILCLFEGVVSGAADGFARMAGVPAMTLLHLGSGLSNAGANLHNARRGKSPMVNVVGDHATYHLAYDAPLTSDIAALARPNSVWMKAINSVRHAGPLAQEAFIAAHGVPAGPATLILPADSAWSEGGEVLPGVAAPTPQAPAGERVEAAAKAIKAAKRPLVLINGSATLDAGLASAARIEASGVRVMTETFVARQARGAGRFAPARMQYFGEMAMADLAGVDLMVLVGAAPPAAFFAYPDKPGLLIPQGCETFWLSGDGVCSATALAMLAEALGASKAGPVAASDLPAAPTGHLTTGAVGASLARHLPEGAIIADDGVTASLAVFAPLATAAPHDWLMLTGGAIGFGLPCAVGAAVAAPGRPVIALTGDGAGMYTNQALWTMAREGLDVLTIVFANKSYRILNIEMSRTGAAQNPGPTAQAMLSLDGPAVEWALMAKALGVDAVRCDTAEDFDRQLHRLMGVKGPRLIEAVV